VALADTRRLGDCFPSVDYFERRQLPFIVAINVFDDAPRYAAEDVRITLDLDPNVPAMLCDSRQRDSVKDALITLVQHVLAAGPMNGHRASGPRRDRLERHGRLTPSRQLRRNLHFPL
jgi:signal recognition particle receptor subunit beta